MPGTNEWICRPRVNCRVYFLIFALGVAAVLSIVYYTSDSLISRTHSHYTIAVAINGGQKTKDDQKPYLLVTHYQDQLSGALEWFTKMVAVSVAMERQPVLPFFSESHLFGIPSNADHIPLSEFYHISEVEKSLRECLPHVPSTFSLSTLQEFVSTSRQADLTTVEFFPAQEYDTKNEIIDCDLGGVAMKRDLKSSIKSLNKYTTKVTSTPHTHFSVVKRVCVFISATVSLETLASQLSAKSTVLFYFGKSARPHFNTKAACSEKSSSECCHTLTWPVSDTVTQTALRVSQQIGLHKPYAAIHVRIERLVRNHLNITQSLECVERMKRLILTLEKQQKLSLNQTVLIHDTGEFGTGSCGGTSKCYEDSKEVLTELREMGLTVLQYKPEGDEIKDRGFVALVEKEIVINAHQLVIMGGGHFQVSIRDNFVLTHNRHNLHTVC